MPTCPAGHQSAAEDYCDECGRRIGGLPETPPAAGAPAGTGPASPGTTGSGTASGAPPAAGPGAEPCPQCGTPRSGRFCEVCRFDFVFGTSMTPAPGPGRPDTGPAGRQAGETPSAAPTGPVSADGQAWSAVVTADRDYFERIVGSGAPEAAAISFPPYCPERRFSLGPSRAGEHRQIGRRSVSRGIDPDIDLTGPPTDPGISRLHAVLIAQPGGGWAVLDPGSENGTLVNDQEIATGVQVPLHDGDRIHLGAWTSITIHRT
jgi:hypothetical protein